MSESTATSLERYGGRVLLGAGAVFVTIWLVAHYTAAAGGTVSVLWGLVEYSKAPLVASNPPAMAPTSDAQHAATQPENSGSAAATLPAVDPATASVIAHSVSGDTATDVLEASRQQRRLRQLSAPESGKQLALMPAGTYGYVAADSLDFSDGDLDFMIKVARIQRFPTIREHDFEVHRPEGTDHVLLAFSSETDAAALTSGGAGRGLAVSPRPWGAFTSLVSFPLRVLNSAHARRVEASAGESFSVVDAVLR